MATKENNTRTHLLHFAKREFLARGYRNVSMRDISNATGMALGNIYYYFKTKDDIYREILKPVQKTISDYMVYHNKSELLMLDIIHMKKSDFEDYLKSPRCTYFFNLLLQNKEDLYMLLFMSQGSSLENYKEDLQNIITDMGNEYLKKYMSLRNVDIEINQLFMKIYASMIMSFIKEIIQHDKKPWKEIEDLYRQFFLFTISGWKTLMRI